MMGAGPILPVLAGWLAAGSTEPVGPSGWPAKSWIGLLVYLGLFLLALWGISRLASTSPSGEDEGSDP